MLIGILNNTCFVFKVEFGYNVFFGGYQRCAFGNFLHKSIVKYLKIQYLKNYGK